MEENFNRYRPNRILINRMNAGQIGVFDMLFPGEYTAEELPAGYIAYKCQESRDSAVSAGEVYAFHKYVLGDTGSFGGESNLPRPKKLTDGRWVDVSEVWLIYFDPMSGSAPYNEAVEALYRVRSDDMLGKIVDGLTATGIKLDSELALTEGIRGAVVDVKNQPTDACIIRIYVGDQTKKREAAAREITRLLGEGYRPYQTFGISEDLARVLFVKYPEPNDAN